MIFKTSQGSDAYKEMVEEMSKVAADMYQKIEHLELSSTERIQVHLAIESFRQEGLSKAILTASTVEVGLLGLQGSLAIATIHTNKE